MAWLTTQFCFRWWSKILECAGLTALWIVSVPRAIASGSSRPIHQLIPAHPPAHPRCARGDPRSASGTDTRCFEESGVKPPHSKISSYANLMTMSYASGNRDLVREFLSYIQVEKGLSANTMQSYARDIAKLQSWAVNANKQIERLERKDLREWIASMSREGLAPSSVSRSVSAARSFFRFLMLDGHIKRHPAEDIHTPQRNTRLPQFLTEEEMEQLLFAPDIKTDLGVRDRALIELMYAAGLRVSEAC